MAHVIKRTIRHSKNGLNLAIEVNAAVSDSSGSGSVAFASSESNSPIVQGPAGRPADHAEDPANPNPQEDHR